MISTIRQILIVLLVSSYCYAAEIDLPQDANGWTVFTPSDDSRIIYVAADGNDSCSYYDDDDAVIGTDPFQPTGTIAPCATYAAAYALARVGYPDWVLFKRGDTFTITSSIVPKGGRSTTEPSLIGAYGATGNSPLIKTRTNLQALRMTGLGSGFTAVSGLDFYAYTRDPEDAGYVAPADPDIDTGLFLDVPNGAVLIEGCKFRFYDDNLVNGPWDGLTIRRSVFLDNYAGTGQSHSQGILITSITSLLLEENVFDHNGWLVPAGGGVGEATNYNHNIYSAYVSGAIYRNNITTRGSNMNLKFTASHYSNTSPILVDNNLIIDGQQGVGLGNNTSGYEPFNDFTISNNVISNLGKSDHLQSIAWGIDIGFDSTDTVVSQNLLINQKDSTIDNNFVFGLAGLQTNVLFTENIAYNFKHGHGLFISLLGQVGSSGTKTNCSFSNNDIQEPTDASYFVYVNAGGAVTSGITFANNNYYGDRSTSDLFRNATTLTSYSLAGWATATGDNSTITEQTYPYSTRDIESYMTSIGETATIDAFITKCRAQDRYNWDTKCSAEAVNNYIRAGFGMKQHGSGGTAAMTGAGSIPLSGAGSMTLTTD